jgi:serine/threonine protein kinase
MPSLIQTLLGSLLDRPIVESLACKAGEKAITTIRAHFTFSAQQMSTAYQDSYGYTLVAISVGVTAPDQKLSLAQKIFNSKISREFAEQIDRHYLQPFAEKVGLSNQDLPEFRLTAAKSLKDFAKHKDKIFQIEQITDDDLMALISYRDTTAITDLVLEQMQRITPVDDTLAAFLRHDGQLGDGVLFFFRELIRKDDRLEKTQAALQREGLCISVQNLQESIKHLKATQQNSPFLAAQLAPQLQDLQQTQTAWQNHHEQLIRFSRRFENRLAEMLEWAKDVYSTLEEIHEDVKVVITQNEEILQILSELMAHQGLSSQIKARDEFTIHNSTSLQRIRDAASQLKQLPLQNPEYSNLSIMVGSALSSTGDLVHAEDLFRKAISNAKKESDKALAYFNLFQVQLRRKAYTDALKNLQAAIAIEPDRYALHEIRKYPLERLLGAGGMGCVFLCRNDNQLIKQEKVVVKCFWENLKGTLKEVFKEPFAMRDIAGDYIPEPLDVGYVQERAFFVTEYIDGAIDGEMWLEKYGTMDLKTGLAVGLKIAKGLQVAHDAGIYHLDLKPANILLLKKTSDVSVKIIDFGLSQVASSLRDDVVMQQSRSGLTMFGQAIFGTLDYAPPEQRGLTQYGSPSARSDLYAFGVTMYRLFSGKEAYPFRERYLPKVPELREILGDCVEAEPKSRPSSARELVSRFSRLVEEEIQEKPQTKIAAPQGLKKVAGSKDDEEADKKAWQTASRENTLEAYQAYLEGNTLKRYATVAKARLQKDEKAWQNACEQDRLEAYQAYLDGNTVKKYAVEAQAMIQSIAEQRDDDAWQKARQQDTTQSYQAYLNGQTLKQYAEEAQTQIQSIAEQQDDEAWQKACQQNTTQSYQAYLDGQTLKQYAKEAQTQIQSIAEQQDDEAWQKACQQDTVEAYQGYLDGKTLKKYATEAQELLQAFAEQQDDEAWQKACQQDTVEAYQAYLNGQTLKKYAEEAKKRLLCYADNGDGTVTDNKTGLIWLKNANCSGRKMTWEEAMQWAAELAHGQCGLRDGSKAGDWRLPTKEEWEAMLDKRYENPALSNAAGTGQWKEGDAFSGLPTSYIWYWSSTEYNTSSAWNVYLDVGFVHSDVKAFTYYVWAVRGGH